MHRERALLQTLWDGSPVTELAEVLSSPARQYCFFEFMLSEVEVAMEKERRKKYYFQL
jgi:hypothetical protein